MTSPITREMQIKNTMENHFYLPNWQRSEHFINLCWLGRGQGGGTDTHAHPWRACDSAQRLGQAVSSYLTDSLIHTHTFWPSKPTSGNLSYKHFHVCEIWHMYKIIHCSTICNCKTLKTICVISLGKINHNTFLQWNTMQLSKRCSSLNHTVEGHPVKNAHGEGHA